MKSEILTASAGAGKTYSLTERVHRLVCAADPFIVALTFTRAATAEMRKRILDRVDGSDADYHAKLQRIMHIGKIRFATFDSFFFRLLAAHGDPVRIADDKETEIMKERIKKTFYDAVYRSGRVEEIVIACRILRTSVESLTDELGDEESSRFFDNRISAGRFPLIRAETAKLKEELDRLLGELQGLDSEKLPARVHTNVVGMGGDSIQDLVKRKAFLHADLSAYGYLGKKLDWASPPLSDINRVFAELRDRLAGYLLNRAILRELTLEEMDGVYRAAADRVKNRERKLFFRDVIDRLIELDGRNAALRAEVMGLCFELGLDRVRHLMIDEFQDTSRDNMVLIAPLIEEVLSEVGEDGMGERSLFVVGDWKQMIYGWRGADREAVEAELSRYMGGQLQRDFLPYNWRSTPLLVDYFNRTVSEIFTGPEQKEHQLPPPEKSHGGLSEIGLVRVEMERGQKAPLYDRMVKVLEQKKAEWGCDYSDITLLFRTNTDKEATARRLAEAGIGFAEVKGRQLLACEEGVAVFSLLAHFFSETVSGFAEKAVEASSFADGLLPVVHDRERILSRYAEPYGLEAVADVLERCRGVIHNAVVETCAEEAEAFFRTGGGDAPAFLAFLFRVREKISVPEPAHSDRVKLATIHGVKGLQFPHVFLLWLEQNKPFPFYLQDEGCRVSFNAEEIAFWETFGSPTARDIVEAHGREKKKIDQEKADLLYVALTRATHSVTVFVKKPGKGKDQKKDEAADTLSEKLTTVLEHGPFDAECERGEDCVYYRKDYGPVPEKTESGPLEIEPVVFPPTGPDTGTPEPDRALLATGIREGIDRGARIHAFLAGLKDGPAIPERHGLSESEFASVTAFLEDKRVSEILFRKGRVYIEQPVSNRELYGIVDRMIVEENRVTIVDYKTGTVGELLDSYLEQVRRYGIIVGSLYPERAVETILLLVDDTRRMIPVGM